MKSQALNLLRKNTINCLKVLFVDLIILIIEYILSKYVLINLDISLSSILSYLYNVISMPLSFGITLYLMRIVNKQKSSFKDIFYYYKNQAFDAFILAAVISLLLYIVFYLNVFLVVVLYIFIRMPQYIFIEKKYSAIKSLQEGVKLINGHKWDYFKYLISFIPWIALGILTFGVAFIFVIPYMSLANIIYYKNLN